MAEKLKEFITVLLPLNQIKISSANYFSFINLMETVGSIANFMKISIFICLTYFMRKQWNISLVREIQRKADKVNPPDVILKNI